MKIYDKKALLMIFLDFAILAYALGHIIRREVEIFHIVVLLYACPDLKTNISAAFSEEGSQKRKEQADKEKKAYKNAFGKFAPLIPVSPFILIGIGILFLTLLPGRMVGVYFILCGIFWPILIPMMVAGEMARMEREQE